MKRPGYYLPPFALALLVTSLAAAADHPHINAYGNAKPAAQPAPLGIATKTSAAGARPSSQAMTDLAASAIVASVDEKRGVPTFLWASKELQSAPPQAVAASKEQAALFHVERIAPRYGLSEAALKTAVIDLVHDTGRGGIIVGLRQEISGIELFQTRMRLLMTRSLELVAVAGNLHEAAVSGPTKGRTFTFKRSITRAVADALGDLYGLPSDASSIADTKTAKAGYAYFSLNTTPAIKAAGVSFTSPARAKKVFFPMPDRLIPAYYVEIQAVRAGASIDDGYAYVIAADDGRVLYRQSLIAFEAFDYRVWADDTANHRPLDGPQADFTPHPTGMPDGSVPDFIPPSLISMEGFNTNPNGLADPWLPAGALESTGNNVDAYTDHTNPDGYSNGDLRASITAPGAFDRVYDTAKEPIDSDDQSMAAVTQLFYVNNWLHDWWYDSGFNEAAGVAQKNNFGRGGVAGDPIKAEAQDGYFLGNRNNANMNTPADGESPRMQMYVWSGKETRSLMINPLNVSLTTGSAGFGAKNYDVTGDLEPPDDGVDPITDGCEPLVGSLAGKIAFVDRGLCTFKLKTFNAEAAGAIAIVITNNAPAGDEKGGVIGMSDGDPSLTVTIPALFISKEDGDAIKAAMVNGKQSATLFRDVQVEHDGTIDNGIIGHEWGHYLHHRLVNCGGVVCGGMSEGWADFDALQMLVREGDNLDGTFATGGYAGVSFTDGAYYGIRRAPYSTDMSKNPFTFKHMTTGEPLPTGAPLATTGGNNAEVHNTGEIWSEMLFEGLIALLKKSQAPGATVTFEDQRRAMSDYIVAGMMLTPPNPTYTEQRDGVLAAALAQDKDDALLLAGAFAKRGAGSCAISPNRYAVDNAGIVESFELKGRVAIAGVKIDDAVKSCDSDGYLDTEETGNVTVEVANTSPLPLNDTEVEVASTTMGATFPNGPKLTIPVIEPFATVKAQIPVHLDEGVATAVPLALTATVTNGDACETTQVTSSSPRVNFDNVANQSTTDTFESDIIAWERVGPFADSIWTRNEQAPTSHVFHAADFASLSDTMLVSPPLSVGIVDPFVLSFRHVYRFETSYDDPNTPEDETVYWDGAVIEISSDGGKNWEDIKNYADPGYNGTISGDAAAVLLNRKAFVDRNPMYPAMEMVTVDMGKKFAGQTVLVRFRVGTDSSGSGEGWTLDDISFGGLINKPFPIVADDASTCNNTPIADAGDDKEVKAGALVLLNATGSSDSDGDPLTFSWTQTGGDAVKLDKDMTATPEFTAPSLDADSTLTFSVTVSDGQSTAFDNVHILVKAKGPDPVEETGAGGSSSSSGGNHESPVEDSGCACEAAGGSSSSSSPSAPSGAPAALLALGLALLRRKNRQPK